MSQLLLCTDMDRTLIPNGRQAESAGARDKFSRLVSHPNVILTYVTGRHKALIEKAIFQYQLPQPDFVIADVGSSIYQVHGAGWEFIHDWEEYISTDWSGENSISLKSLFASFKDIRLQEISKQGRYKLSFYVPLYVDTGRLLEKMGMVLEQKQIKAKLVWSIDEPKGIGLLDILPEKAGKYESIRFLMSQLGIGLKETVFAGDSGNDLEVMASNIQSVLVANASDEVRKHAHQLVQDNGLLDALYFAKGDFLGMNGNYSAGILEGVSHYLPEATTWMGAE
jgi:sucrose-6F-phosphate phosphohydrolase